MIDETGFERKILYSVAEVAAITGCPPGRVKRWIYRRQLDAIGLEDVPLVPYAAVVARLERIEAARARRRAGIGRRLPISPPREDRSPGPGPSD